MEGVTDKDCKQKKYNALTLPSKEAYLSCIQTISFKVNYTLQIRNLRRIFRYSLCSNKNRSDEATTLLSGRRKDHMDLNIVNAGVDPRNFLNFWC